MTFEDFWKSVPRDMGPKGSKFEANKEWDKLKPDAELCATIAKYMIAKAEIDRNDRKAGKFVANWVHVVRFIKQKRWLDDLPYTKPQRARGGLDKCACGNPVEHIDTCWACYDAKKLHWADNRIDGMIRG